MITELKNVDGKDMSNAENRKALESVQLKAAKQDELMHKLTATGVALGKDSVLGIKVTTKGVGRGAKGRPWCQLVISNELISSSIVG